jgi:hypothetical protein
VRNGHREAVATRAAGRVDEGRIGHAGQLREFDSAGNHASVKRVARDEAGQVGPELAEMFVLRLLGIAGERAIDNGLRQARVEVARGALNNEDARIASGAVVLSEGPIDLAGLRVRRRDDPVVASAGRTAFRISASLFVEPVESSYQKAASSPMTATAITPRMPRNDALRTSTSIPLASAIDSAVRLVTNCESMGTWSNKPAT